MKTREQIAREVGQRIERAWASPHAAGVRRPGAAPKSEAPKPLRLASPAKAPCRAVQVNSWLSPESAAVVEDAMSRMVPPPTPSRPRRRRKPKPVKPRKVAHAAATSPRDDGLHLWWRTLSKDPTRCHECRTLIHAGERYVYRHEGREVRCRDCGADQWGDARPSKALRRYAEHRRLEDLDRKAA